MVRYLLLGLAACSAPGVDKETEETDTDVDTGVAEVVPPSPLAPPDAFDARVEEAVRFEAAFEGEVPVLAVVDAGELPADVGPPVVEDGTVVWTVELPFGRWSWTVAQGEAVSVSRSLLVHRPPTAPTVEITPALPRTGDSLSASVVGPDTDLDGDAISYALTWLLDGEPTTEAAVVAGDVVSRGQLWTASVIASDAFHTLEAVEASRSVGNVAPVIDAVHIDPEEPALGDRVTVTVDASDAENDRLRVATLWRPDAFSTWRPFVGSFVVSGIVSDVAVRAQVSDAEDTVVRDTPLEIVNSAPELQTVRILPATARTGTPVSAESSVFDADRDPITRAYQWLEGGQPIVGATGLTYTDTFRGDVLTVTVTVTDPDGLSDVATSAAVTVGNASPPAPVVQLAPAGPLAAEEVVCSATVGLDPEGDEVTTTIRWLGPSSLVVDGDTLLAGTTTVGEMWTCEATARDGEGGVSVGAKMVTIGAAP